ncbi:MAG: DEAD/DEAH box helicase family protein [Desulfobacteraceae bacterium]|nr:DEAD/DEAH box helicase family protein [Desulfobacteraceae bacterium]
MNTPIKIGQRWISEAEPELGLGILVDISKRTLCIDFVSSQCQRTYSMGAAPIKRMVFKPGDVIESKDKTTIEVKSVRDKEGLLYYENRGNSICESDLSGNFNFTMPQDRLFAGITEKSILFDLRYQALKFKSDYEASDARGFMGGQIELLPHQLYIARQVTSRYIPRVLLSDETGLGKTIEACLILHKLLVTQRIGRVLVLVPDSLVHQWFVELYKKFNLSFRIFDHAHCLESELADSPNPFLDDQLGICSIDFLISDPKRQNQVLTAGWDMVVIDEAHHITEKKDTYTFIQHLEKATTGLMLLTATPEQLGVQSHFSQLKLLDPERYFNFEKYRTELKSYQETAQKVEKLLKDKQPIDHFLDSYGPGRVIFRNRRSVIKGFPKKQGILKGFDADAGQIALTNEEFNKQAAKETRKEYLNDPRIHYLISLLQSGDHPKILLICNSKTKVNAIDQAVKRHIKIDIARFDETMSILRRDKNAVWFAKENGARLLISSEIGSEGRNFQFVHTLFLFDLPMNPELLEQRIGRVDRIGQKNDIRIYVPYIRETGHEILAKWYMLGLNIFEKNIPGVHYIFKKFEPILLQQIKDSVANQKIDQQNLSGLITQTREFCHEIKTTLEKGKNILLELNSFKPGTANTLANEIRQTDASLHLEQLVISLLTHFGLGTDEMGKRTFCIDSEDIADESFPLPSQKDRRFTFDRDLSIVREDLDFFNWDHPYVNRLLEYFITKGTGSACLAAIKSPESPAILLETVFILDCIAPRHLNLERYLPQEPIRLVVDHHGHDVTSNYPFNKFQGNLFEDEKNWFKTHEAITRDLLPVQIKQSLTLARTTAGTLIKNGKARIKRIAGSELDRLKTLQKINPDIKDREIKIARDNMNSLQNHIASARLRLDALRLIRTL